MTEMHGKIVSSDDAELDLLEQALDAIDRLQAELDRQRLAQHEPIAIIGAGCRYPGGITDPESLWQLVQGGVDAITAIPEDRWDVQRHMHPVAATPGKMYANRGGYLDDVKTFDAQFFGITPREAEYVDPQQRLLLEVAYEAFESAGIAVDGLQGSRTGVFVGGPSPDFGYRMQKLSDEHSNIYQVNGTGQHAAAGRVSYSFGLMGPSVSIDTACSTSLVAIHLACRSLRAGEIDLGIAGAVSILLGQYGAVLFSQGQLMAPDGFCKAFDAAADGFVRSEGGGVLALKRLSDAQRDGDPILAIIRGTATNSDGRSVGITQPHGPAQEALVRMALADAGLAPADIDYVEAHGTGTPTGDPIEVEALANVLGEGRPADRPLLLGSIKTNIGHTEAASGVAGLLKVIGALRHEEIPASLHFNNPNPRIEWDRVPVKVVGDAIAWPRHAARPRRAGISGFGFSGTNAHVIIEEPPVSPAAPAAEARLPEPRLVPLSARSTGALMALAERHADHLAANPDIDLADVALTLGAGREHMPVRAALIVESVAELERGLRRIADGEIPEQPSGGEEPRIAFLFTGQGAQYAGMGRGLYESEPVFRAMIDRAAAVLDDELDRPFLDVLFAEDAAASPIDETGYTQPALFAIECALAELWRSWGISPSVAVGHSIGELSAACVGGVFGFEDGLRLVAERGRLMQALPRDGAMAAVFADEAEVSAALKGHEDRLSVAGINGPEETVVSGDADVLAHVVAALDARGIGSRRLDVSHAFHSPLLDPMLDAFEERAAQTPHALPQVTIVSNLTGVPFPDGTGPDAGYWRRHARDAVRFAPAMRALADARIDMLVEIGPSPILLSLAAQGASGASWGTVASLRRGRDDRREMLAAARDLYLRGASLDWQAMPSGRGGRRLALPTYAFQRNTHWIFDRAAEAEHRRTGNFHHLLGERVPGPGPAVSFVNELSAEAPAYLAQHSVFGTAIVPGAGIMELMLAAGRAVGLRDAIVLEQVVFRAPVKLDVDEVRQLHTELLRDGDGWMLTLRSAALLGDPDAQEWIEHATARVRGGQGLRTNTASAVADLRPRATIEVPMDLYYADNESKGLVLGPIFQAVQREFVTGDGEVVASLELSPDVPADPLVNIHPIMFDASIQATGSLVAEHARGALHIPISVDEVVLYRPATPAMASTARAVEVGGSMFRYDVRIEDPDGELVLTMSGLMSQTVTPESMGAGIRTQTLVPRWHEAAAAGKAVDPKGLRLLVADAGGFAAELAQTIVERGGAAKVINRTEFADAIGATDPAPVVVIDCTALDPAEGEPTADAERRCLELIERARTLAARSPMMPLCIVTRGAHDAAPGDAVALHEAPLAGLSRTLAVEQMLSPRLRIDLDPATTPDARLAMRALAGLSVEEPELAVRQGALLAPRLQPLSASRIFDPQTRTALTIVDRGDFDGLRFEMLPRRAPAAHEVEIEVRAAGLNFRDLINALGMYPAPVPPLGSECAGIVTAVGSGITDLAVGDEVVAIAPESFASHCLCPRPLVARKPANLSFAEAATIPNAYLTAQLCLEVAELKPGQRVLIHAAAGGVGSAVLRLAKLAGLEIFATAGNDTKRAFARDRGAAHVFDSRSLAFADQIMEVTGGEGVDCVINSLAGEFIEAGLRIIRPGGCFVEIGKQGLWTEEQVAAVAPGVRYRVEDLGASAIDTPDVVQANFAEIMTLAEASEIDPLPVEAFPLSASKQAFRHMANARHIGKIVLVPDEWAPTFAVRGDGTYLITGGLGGIGLKLIRWLVEQGAGHVVTLSRSGGAGHEALLEELNAAGPTGVTAVACDVGDAQAVESLWRDTLPALPPLRGIFHAAGVLADAPLEDQDQARFEKVRRPKMDGAWHLHAASARDPLDVFVMFSSTAALFGSAGQANYSAANAFLDGLAAYRRRRGLPATSIAWGPWAEVGMAAEMETQRALWARGGIGMVEPAEGIAAMVAILSTAVPSAAVAALDLQRVGETGPAIRTLLGIKVRNAASVSGAMARPATSAKLAAFKALADNAPAETKRAALQAYLHDEIARVLGFEASALEADTSLSRLGLDSLMAVQVRNTIAAQLGVDLPVKELLQGHSVVGLTGAVQDIMIGVTENEAKSDGGGAQEDAWEEGTL